MTLIEMTNIEEQNEETEIQRLCDEDQEGDAIDDTPTTSIYESSYYCFNCSMKKMTCSVIKATTCIAFLSAIAQDDELLNSVESYFYRSHHPSRSDLQICPIQNQSCPDKYAYKPSCKISAMHEAIHEEGHLALPKLKDPSNFLTDLLTFFHGKRIALVGDSLTRQWFETLSCRLGLKQTWFKTTENLSKLPPRLSLAKNKYNVTFSNVHIGPRHMKSGHYYGYVTSRNQFSSTSKLDKLQDGSACQPFYTSIEYYHVDLLKSKHQIQRI